MPIYLSIEFEGA